MFTIYIQPPFFTSFLRQSLLIILITISFTNAYTQTAFENATTFFLGKPYVAATLDRDSTEHLLINLNELDCTTFVEYVMASLISGQKPDSLNDIYRQTLQNIRYRGGEIKNYTSRLHYFSEWIAENQRIRHLTDISASLGGKEVRKEIDFMSAHPGYYPALNKHPELIDSLRIIESQLSHTSVSIIPKEKVGAIGSKLQTGDLIAITTSIKGLDISHVGFVTMIDGVPHLLHASSSARKVIVDPLPLAEYIARLKKATGIRVMRIPVN